MATIPRLTQPRVQQSPLSGVRTAAPSVNPGATQGAFGERQAEVARREGEALGQVGAAAVKTGAIFQEANNRLQAREDSIRRTRALATADTAARQLILEEESGGDLSLPENVTSLRDRVNQQFDQAVGEFGGGLPENSLIFQEDMARLRAKLNAELTQKGVAAARGAMDSALSNTVTQLSGVVASNPAALTDAQAELSEYIQRNYAPAMNAEDEAAAVKAGMETLATSAVDFLISSANYGDALTTLESPNVQPFLSPERARQLRLKIYTGQGEEQKLQAEIQTRLRIMEDAGVEITPQIAAAAATGVNIAKTGPRTLADKVVEFEAMMARANNDPNFAASAEEVQKLAGATPDKADPLLGKGFQGRGIVLLNDLAPGFEAGTLSEQETRFFLTVAGALQNSLDSQGNRFELPATLRATLATQGFDARSLISESGIPAVSQALEAAPGDFTTGGALPLTDPNALVETDPAAGRAEAPTDPTSTASTTVLSNAVATADPNNPRSVAEAIDATGINFYNVANELTGIGSTLRQVASGAEIIGDFVKAPETRQARQAFAAFIPFLIASFQQTERFGNAERESLEEKLKFVQGSFGKNPNALQEDLIGLDNFLSVQEANLRELVEKEGSTSGKQFAKNKDALADIALSRRLLGVPPLITDDAHGLRLLEEGVIKPGDKVRLHGQPGLHEVQ